MINITTAFTDLSEFLWAKQQFDLLHKAQVLQGIQYH